MRARIFLFLYLFIALTPLQVREELDRLPDLAAHYTLHRGEDPDIDILSFLSQHYGQGFARHQSDHDHSELPGKSHPSHDCTCSASSAQLAPIALLPVLNPPLEPLSPQYFQEVDLLPSTHPDNIWQPPRTA
jgi:hypothetical protein